MRHFCQFSNRVQNRSNYDTYHLTVTMLFDVIWWIILPTRPTTDWKEIKTHPWSRHLRNRNCAPFFLNTQSHDLAVRFSRAKISLIMVYYAMMSIILYLPGWVDKNCDRADVVGFRKTVDFAHVKWPEGQNFESILWPIAFYNRKSKNGLPNWALLKIH